VLPLIGVVTVPADESRVYNGDYPLSAIETLCRNRRRGPLGASRSLNGAHASLWPGFVETRATDASAVATRAPRLGEKSRPSSAPAPFPRALGEERVAVDAAMERG
jgi:hypothetical protein